MMFLILLLMPLYVYGGNFSSHSMFDTITRFQFPHEKMGFKMVKHINHTIADNNINHIIDDNNSDERYLSNTQINMWEMRECDIETSNVVRSYIFGVRVNYCFKCSHTSSYLADINSCKYDIVSLSSNDFTVDFHTYTDSSCSTGDINQFDIEESLNICQFGYEAIYTANYQYDVSIPGLNEVEYSDTSCSTPFAFLITGIVKGTCIQFSASSSMKIVDCTNNNLQVHIYPNTYCGGNTFTYETEQQGICSVPTSYLIWYEELSATAIIDYSNERVRFTRYCSSIYSPIQNLNPTLYPTRNPTRNPTSNIGITPPNDADYTETCDNCPSYHMWTVQCGTFGTPNTDIMCGENGDEFTCCASRVDECCVANGGTITGLVLGIIAIICFCGYKCRCMEMGKQNAIMTASTPTPSVLDRNSNTFLKKKNSYTPTPSGKELIKTTIKPPQKAVQATPSSMEEGIPLAEATVIQVQQKTKKSKRKR